MIRATSKAGEFQDAVLMDSLSAENDLPWEDVPSDDVECRLEDFPKAFALPVERDSTNGEELLAIETRADGLFLANNIIDHVELIDDFPGDEIVGFTASVEPHLE